MKIRVLDHGYVDLVEAWGHGSNGDLKSEFEDNDYERGIVEAARQSTQGSFRGWTEDNPLMRRLWRGKADDGSPLPETPRHATPFEFAGMIVEVQAPIFVFREWHRHRTQSYNEASARYAPLPDLYYTPDLQDVIERAGTTTTHRQAQGTKRVGFLMYDEAKTWLERVEALYKQAEGLYQEALAAGVPKELARITMPVGHYSRMRASANLRNWLQFLALRMVPDAQYEIRCYANAVHSILQRLFPQVVCLFDNARLGVSGRV